MQEISKWFDRRFTYAPPVGEFPMIVERLRGTPDRVEKKLSALPRQLMTERIQGQWSIQEHVGHLIDLEDLWYNRMEELLAGAEVLTAADLTNRKTYEAAHNDRPISDIISRFRGDRMRFIRRLDELDTPQIEASARHPRLDQQMRAIDLCLFVAEHDDQHLAIITRTQLQLAGL